MKSVLLIVAVMMATFGFGQSQPNNLQIGIFDNGSNGSNAASAAQVEIALKTIAGTYGGPPTLPVAETFTFILKAPKTFFNTGETIILDQNNPALFTPSGGMIYQATLDLPSLGGADDGYIYFTIVLESVGTGVNLSSLTSTNYSYAFTFHFSTPKTTAQLQTLRILDRTNNGTLNAALSDDIYTRIDIAGVNQLTNAAFTVLPVHLGAYDLKCNDKGATLSWTTTNETNTQRFEIQRSENGSDWNVIDHVAAAGNSSVTKNYQYNDPYNGVAYYRIRQVDADGRFIYTDMRRTDCKVPFEVSVYPVPAKDKLTVSIRSDRAIETDLQVHDLNGRIIRKIKARINKGNNTFEMNVNDLPGGQYMLSAADPSVIINKKFTVGR